MSTNNHKRALEIIANQSVNAQSIVGWLAVNCPAVFVRAYLATAPRPDPKKDPNLLEWIAADKKIRAIKRWREITGDSLLDAKNAVESMIAERRGSVSAA